MAGAADLGRRVLQPEDLYRLRFVQEVALAPDSARVAFTVLRPDPEANANRYSLWVVPAAGGEARRLAAEEPRDPSPAWSPDGARLAFVARRGGRARLLVLDLERGEERQVPAGEERDIAHPAWSPDGTRLAYLGWVPAVPAPRHPVAYPGGEDAPRVVTRARYKFDGLGFFDHTREQLFVVPVDGGAPTQLTRGALGVGHPALTAERGVPIGHPVWSPDSARIAFVAGDEGADERDECCDVWTVDVGSGALTRVTPHDGLYGCPAWSPEGAALAVVGDRLPRQGGANSRLWVVPAAGGTPTLVTDFDRSIGLGIMSDTGAPTRAQPAWVGPWLYFLAAWRGTAQVWRVPAAGGAPEPVTAGAHAIGAWAVAGNGATLAYSASTPTSPGDVYGQQLDRAGEPARRLTALNDEALAEVALSEPEEFWLPVGDGTDTLVQGWIMRPPHPPAATGAPLILEIHGGPAALYGASWFHEFQCLAAHGYAVIYANPRGAQGYGEAFSTCIYRDWGTKPLADVLAAAEHAVALGGLDPARQYVTGGSYGGYLVNWAVTHTDRFRAAATGRCVSDLRTLALADDTGTWWMGDYFGGMPWETPDVYAFGSPITHIAACRTPLLIEHQAEDHRCPLDQAEQVYNALRKLGVPTELVLYPGESHGMSRNGRPLHRVDRVRRILDWFARHG
ncbi:MAG TPA: S9 family peptidase [Thermomicrobiales bacterium]|nr:S9 family peptidase [Thermomicrobiales bacterium]